MKDDRVYLSHLRDALQRVMDYTAAGREAFFSDPKSQDAVIRNLEVVGEAAKRVTENTRALSPDIPWKVIAGMRDKLIHEYFGVNLEIVWRVVAVETPALHSRVVQLLELLNKDSPE